MADEEGEAPDAKPPVKRGRKSETTVQRIERLERELQAARHIAKEGDRRKFETVGIAILAEAEKDPELKSRVVAILRRRVTTAAGRADIATLLVGS